MLTVRVYCELLPNLSEYASEQEVDYRLSKFEESCSLQGDRELEISRARVYFYNNNFTRVYSITKRFS